MWVDESPGPDGNISTIIPRWHSICGVETVVLTVTHPQEVHYLDNMWLYFFRAVIISFISIVDFQTISGLNYMAPKTLNVWIQTVMFHVADSD